MTTYICDDRGCVMTEHQREFNLDCPCGGRWVAQEATAPDEVQRLREREAQLLDFLVGHCEITWGNKQIESVDELLRGAALNATSKPAPCISAEAIAFMKQWVDAYYAKVNMRVDRESVSSLLIAAVEQWAQQPEGERNG